jgi:cob(I)alamin adenosyltransferase
MTPFYTRSGDDGTTGLLGEGRVSKADPRMEALGAVDEANAALGLARCQCRLKVTGETILRIQRQLYQLMAELAAAPDQTDRFHSIDGTYVKWLEEEAERIAEQVGNPREFIIPGDSLAGAWLDMARTIVRRAERRTVDLTRQGVVKNPDLMRYLNRLSTLCFLMELHENLAAGKDSPTLAKST